MSITIKELEKPNLSKIKMNCDDVIHEKLTKYPMVSDCWATSSFNVIVGKMGQGKTSLVTSLVKKVFCKCFESIYIASILLYHPIVEHQLTMTFMVRTFPKTKYTIHLHMMDYVIFMRNYKRIAQKAIIRSLS